MKSKKLLPLVISLLAGTQVSCDDPKGPQLSPNAVIQTVTPAGAVLTSKDGNLTVTVPAGALRGNEVISIDEIPLGRLAREFRDLPVERAYELGPSGLTFSKPITLSFASDQHPIRSDSSVRFFPLALFTSVRGRAESFDSVRMNITQEGTTVTGTLRHFSPAVVVQSNEGITLTAEGVPDRVEADRQLFVRVTVTGAEFDMDAVYSDHSVKFRPVGETSIVPKSGNVLQASFPYKCESAGAGRYSAFIVVSTRPGLIRELTEGLAPFLTASVPVEKKVECLARKFTLIVKKDGSGTGRVDGGPGSSLLEPADGINCGSRCELEVVEGSPAFFLFATPDEHSAFDTWGGVCTSNTLSTIVQVKANSICTATFKLKPTHNVTVSISGQGSGDVTSEPTGINCSNAADGPKDCAAAFPEGTQVKLVVTPGSNSRFHDLSGCGETTTLPIKFVIVNFDMSCTVRIPSLNVELNIFPGYATLTVGQQLYGVQVTVRDETGIVERPITFSSSDESVAQVIGSGSTASIKAIAEGNTTIIATIGGTGGGSIEMGVRVNSPTRSITLNAIGGGTIGYLKSTIAFSCDQPTRMNCDPQLPIGESLTITAVPQSGWQFLEWQGDCVPGGVLPPSTANQICTAVFTPESPSRVIEIDWNSALGGAFNSTPAGIACNGDKCAGAFVAGSVVELQFIADANVFFGFWSGGCADAGINRSATVIVNSDIACAANTHVSPLNISGLDVVSLDVGQTQQLMPTLTDGAGAPVTGRTITYSSSNESVTTVNANGLVTAVGAGNANIVVSVDGDAGRAVTVPVTIIMLPVRYVFTLNVIGEGSVMWVSEDDPGGHTICGSMGRLPCTFANAGDESYSLLANPENGWRFVEWQGDCAPDGDFLMNFAARVCTAVFESNPAQLSVNVSKTGGGSGTVVSEPAAIACGSDCSAFVLLGSTMTFDFTADAGSFFGNWGGDCAAGGINTSATVLVNSDMACTANIHVSPLNIDGINAVSLDVGQTEQLMPTLTDGAGAPVTGRTVTYSSSNEAVVTVNANGLVTAVGAGNANLIVSVNGDGGRAVTVPVTSNVLPARYVFTLNVIGEGSVMSVSEDDPAGHTICGSGHSLPCTFQITGDDGLSLLAFPASGWRFVEWQGDCAPDGNVAMNGADRTCTAVFEVEPVQYTFTQQKTGAGDGTIVSDNGAINCGDQCTALFDGGQTFTLIATANGNSFRGNWAGACSGGGSEATVTVTINEALTCGMQFYVAPLSITSPASITFEQGLVRQMLVQLRDATNTGVTGRTITYSSSNTSVATVNSTGLITGVAEGNVDIVATINGDLGRSVTVPTIILPPGPCGPAQTASMNVGVTSDPGGHAPTINLPSTLSNALSRSGGSLFMNIAGLGFGSGGINQTTCAFTVTGFTTINGNSTMWRITGSYLRDAPLVFELCVFTTPNTLYEMTT